MKTAIIPAQITTVEDRIAGNLNLTQILLLLAAIFLSTTIYLSFPPGFHFTLYKLPLIAAVIIIFTVLSLRIKGKIVLNWLAILLKFNLRPKYYIANKNDLYLRTVSLNEPVETTSEAISTLAEEKDSKSSDFANLKQLFSNPEQLIFKPNKKGGLNVVVAQIKQ